MGMPSHTPKVAASTDKPGQGIGSRMMSIGNEGRTANLMTDLEGGPGYRFVAEKANHRSDSHCPQMLNGRGIHRSIMDS